MTYPFPPDEGPRAPERNPRIHPEYYAPSRFNISDISLGLVTIVTTSVPHNYVVGQQVRLYVPVFYGTYQISGKNGIVMSIPSPTEVTIDINSVGYNRFNPTPTYVSTSAQIMAIGDVNTGAINADGGLNQSTAIPGSFINISPA
jgi:hypothetical protein